MTNPTKYENGELVEMTDAEAAQFLEGQQLAANAVPQQVTSLQLELALLQLGMLEAVNAAVAAAPSAAQITWRRMRDVERVNAMLVSMATGPGGLGMTDVEVDDLFRLALTL
jgi:hypothetical protein